mmetsp:Transcript_82446/g.163611  ORF Transcript_82446/g.163611 Transcript_82446/m.163611 type:complete len:109 (-) Transcript_82446:887-1213(-)
MFESTDPCNQNLAAKVATSAAINNSNRSGILMLAEYWGEHSCWRSIGTHLEDVVKLRCLGRGTKGHYVTVRKHLGARGTVTIHPNTIHGALVRDRKDAVLTVDHRVAP